MKRFFTNISRFEVASSSGLASSSVVQKNDNNEIDLKNLESDPGLRKKISMYHPNVQDEVRRAYMLKGPCQPLNHNFPQTNIGGYARRFNPDWFKEYGNWLEYSIAKDAAFCLCCYLFRQDSGKQAGGDTFVVDGFKKWNKKDRFDRHVGGPNSAHNCALNKCQNFMKPSQNIQNVFVKQSEQVKREYRARLNASLDCIRFLLRQGLPFRGNDEDEGSSNRGNFLELLQFLADRNENIKNVVLENAPKNLKLVSSDIQKDLINCAALETTIAIISDIGDDVFTILVDESRDVSYKEQMAIALRYVDAKGFVVERFVGILHVTDTSASSLKEAIMLFFSTHGLSLSKLRGQGYDGASNMRGEFNGLKTLIMNENPSAYYVHCFAHQLQLTIVAVASKHKHIAWFFNKVFEVLNVVGASCKRRDSLREKEATRIEEALFNNELKSGRGLNQETSLKRAGDTCWGSHFDTLLNLIHMFPSVINVLEDISEDGVLYQQKGVAFGLLDSLQSFSFAFDLIFLKKILSITNELSQALQRRDQDIVNAMDLVQTSKRQLKIMRDNGWEILLDEVCQFCNRNKIDIVDMNALFHGRSRRKSPGFTNYHHYYVEIFCTVLDWQLQELNDRFSEANTELFLSLACLDPSNDFIAFDKSRLIYLAGLYPCDFSTVELMKLDSQLDTYILDVRSHEKFKEVKGISDLSRKLVDTKKHIVFPLVYRLIKLALVLPVATATVERAFSAMKIIKSRLRNRMADQLMNDCLVTYIEKDVFDSIENECIMQRFQRMKTRRGQL